MILITTAGKVGAHSARVLAAAGQPVRVLIRNPDAHRDLADAGVDLFHGDLDRPDSIAAAMIGTDAIVLVTPAVPEQEIAVIVAARNAGVAHVTKVTSDATPDSPISRRRDHYRIEQALTDSGLTHTLLRANAYMQNLLTLAPAIATTSAFSSSTGDGRIGMIDARDVAAAAASIASAPAQHIGKTYRLSGPASLSYDTVAAQLTEVLGRTVTHHRISSEEQEATMIQLGLPTPVAHSNAQALELFAQGDSDWTSVDIERITRRQATPFARFAADYADRFSTASE
ncbi:NAD(P)-dependent oxidoreductase [Arthrobacter livingstonensis]|uniref:NAD(P)-dependent oxidoreductase n=1 Tax=Arthrobacter livingstonensis TaxID=670078 RepID=A0A2V5KZQ1_9MICC|nr:NmrA family NAD(P)-binding protein [Arthrobacter livingstonensis]PYI64148.1 NAD(P)-dependent oxidoreductase [Arthrobacter livingstonensis]